MKQQRVDQQELAAPRRSTEAERRTELLRRKAYNRSFNAMKCLAGMRVLTSSTGVTYGATHEWEG